MLDDMRVGRRPDGPQNHLPQTREMCEQRTYIPRPCSGNRRDQEMPMLASLIIKTAIWLAVSAALLFVPAGTLAWPQAWIYLIEIAVTGALITGWLYVHDPALLAQRMASPVQRE